MAHQNFFESLPSPENQTACIILSVGPPDLMVMSVAKGRSASTTSGKRTIITLTKRAVWKCNDGCPAFPYNYTGSQRRPCAHIEKAITFLDGDNAISEEALQELMGDSEEDEPVDIVTLRRSRGPSVSWKIRPPPRFARIQSDPPDDAPITEVPRSSYLIDYEASCPCGQLESKANIMSARLVNGTVFTITSSEH